jgi:hypothetical protein
MRSAVLRRACLPAVALVAGSAVAVAAAPGQSGRTLTFSSPAPVAREFRQVDVRPHGLSIGDHFVGAVSLRAGGRVAGRMHVACTIIDRRYEGQDCDFVLVLRDGTVAASGGGLDRRLPGQAPSPPHAPDEFAVTGGTGAYRGASGVLSWQAHADDSSTITLSLGRDTR